MIADYINLIANLSTEKQCMLIQCMLMQCPIFELHLQSNFTSNDNWNYNLN